MKLTQQQVNHLHRLVAAHANAKDFSEGVARQERLDKYMENLIAKGVDIQEITDALY